MSSRGLLVVLIALVSTRCSEPVPDLTYRGPDVSIRDRAGVLETRITVPTAGFTLRWDAAEQDGSLLHVHYTLEEPAPDEVVAQVVSELSDELALPAAVRQVQLRVARVIRGAVYVVAPPHELAAVLER